jgi:uncharacterized protein (TIGR02453 family)
MGFSGFRQPALTFFRDLAAQQDRAWFQANRDIYEAEVVAPARALIAELSAELARRDIPLAGDAKGSLFRLHRDVRFSRDKAPFKTHAGIVLHRPGAKKLSPGILYVHIDPQGCFTAAGAYRPEPELLSSLREGIRVRPDAWAAVERAMAEAGHALETADSLTRMPRGFEDLADSPVAPALRLRSFLVRRPLTLRQVGAAGLVETLADFAESALPLLRFGWRAVDEAGAGVAP